MSDQQDDLVDADAVEPILRHAVAALPRELPPPPGGWPRLQESIAAERKAGQGGTLHQLPRARTRPNGLFGAAGVAAIIAATVLLFTRGRIGDRTTLPSDNAVTALTPDERGDPRVRAVLDVTRSWRYATRDTVRSARWPAEARDAVDRALRATDVALRDAREAVRRDPTDVVARDAVVSLRERQLALLQGAITLLDEL